MGITHIGGSTPAQSRPDAKESTSADAIEAAAEAPEWRPGHQISEGTPEAKPPQVNLFGEIVSTEVSAREMKTKMPSAPESDSLEVWKDASLEDIRNDLGECRRCRLHEQRTNIVFGEGNPEADLVFVGEGPGADEDRTGRPFVGKAGKLLDKIIEAMGMKRGEVYIANVVKCRPPDNRTPERDEAGTCGPFLFRQLGFIRPKVIVALGAPALQCLTGSREGITKVRGHWQEWHGIKVMPTYHPAYLLRVPDKKKETWEDMKRVRDYIVKG
jgi:DNA polymerase